MILWEHWSISRIDHQQKARLPLLSLLCPLRSEFGEDAFRNDFFSSNDNVQYHIRNEIEALILFFKYKIASILKLTYKFSIHLIFDSLLLSKCTYKEWITETVCSEIKFIFQICQFKCNQSLFSGHPTNVPKMLLLPPLPTPLSLGQARDLRIWVPKEQVWQYRTVTPLTSFSSPVSFYKFEMFLGSYEPVDELNSLDQWSRITAPFLWYPCLSSLPYR